MWLLLLSPVTRLFSLALLLSNHRRSPYLRLPVPHCSTFPIVCDIPNTAVLRTASTECFPALLPNCSLNLSSPFRWLHILPVRTVQSHISRSHIRCISVHKLLYLLFFGFLLHDISVRRYCHIYQHACCLFFVFIIISGPFSVTSLSLYHLTP